MDTSSLACLTFDCYGTLIDWEGGLGGFLYDFALRAREPDPPPGRELRERWEAIQFEVIGGDYPPDRILHVAFGFKYDTGPAQQPGFRSAWVNRRDEPRPGPARPDLEWRDLWGLAQLADAR